MHSNFIGKKAQLFFKEKVFFPHKNNPINIPHDKLDIDVFYLDVWTMKQSNRAVVFFPIGKDCSSEIGWFAGANKYICIFLIKSSFFSIKEQLDSLLTSWMLKGFIDEIFVEDTLAYKLLKKDNILKHKTSLLTND